MLIVYFTKYKWKENKRRYMQEKGRLEDHINSTHTHQINDNDKNY